MLDSINKIDPNMGYRQNNPKQPREGEEEKHPPTEKKRPPSPPLGPLPDNHSHLIDIVG
jgi:hypothetical protein